MSKLRRSISENRIVISHQNDRHIAVLTDPANQIEDSAKSRSGGQSTLRGELNRRPIGHRIREGEAEFNQVGSGLDKAVHQLLASCEIRISGSNESNQGFFATCFQSI